VVRSLGRAQCSTRDSDREINQPPEYERVAAAPSNGLTPAQNAAIAQSIAQAIAAGKAPIVAAQTQADQASQQQQQNITGLSAALGEILKGIGPGVEQTYSDASARQSAFAKGFSDHMQEQLGQNAKGTSSFLQNVVGAPASQIADVAGKVAPAAAGDTLYGLRGYIPASNLNEEGAAFAAAAKELPGIADAQGLQQIAKVQAAQRTTDQGFATQLADLMAKVPGLRTSLESQYRTADYHQAVMDALNNYRSGVNPSGVGTLPGYQVDPVTGAIAKVPPGYTINPGGQVVKIPTPVSTKGAIASATKTALGIIKAGAKQTTAYGPKMVAKQDPLTKLYITATGAMTSDISQAALVPSPTGGRVAKGTRFSQPYYDVIHQVESAVAPLVPAGWSTGQVVKFVQGLVNPYFPAGKGGRPGSGTPKATTAISPAAAAVAHPGPR
jgi:hypothetical protein